MVAALPAVPRLLRDDARSHGTRPPHGEPENSLIHGENLRALTALAATMQGRFQCIYLDPPFNSGRAFAEYDDRRTRNAWLAMMRARLHALLPLLAESGAVFVEIDDTELGPLQVLMDEVFSAKNRVSTITIVRSAATGHKAINPGPVNVADYLLVYAKDRARLRYVPQVRTRVGYDPAYRTYVPDIGAPMEEWRFEPLGTHAARALGFATRRDATRVLGADRYLREMERFAIANAARVVRFAQPRYEAVSKEARALIDRSRAEPTRVFVLERARHKPLVLRAGNRLLFLADKVREVDGARVLVEPLTNVWDDVPFQGIAKEGGVVFSRNKKPERLLARVLAMVTAPGDWVLDPFLGSGTTAAVAHKMGRRWVGIEEGEHCDLLCLPRLRRVVAGEDPTGVTRACGWTGGGGFGVYA
jgi:adenine-specific DNA-methyltransferase